jgi:stage II sporulation protein D
MRLSKIFTPLFSLLFFTSCVSMGERYTESPAPKSKNVKKQEIRAYSGPAPSDSVKLNVLIYRSKEKITVNSDKNMEIPSQNIPAAKKYSLTAVNGRIEAEGYFFGTNKIEITSPSVIFLGKKSYRGSFVVYADNNELFVVNKVPLEEYLYGVLPSEISPNWDEEVLKAQAVAARTFALYKKNSSKDKRWDLEATVASQVYNGFGAENTRTNKAVNETAKKVLYYKDKLIEAFFHSNSGGRTASSEEVWGGKNDFLVSVDDEAASGGSHYRWEAVVSKSKISAALENAGKNSGAVHSLSVADRSGSGRAAKIRVKCSEGEISIKGKDLRQWLGNDLIKSTKFEIHDQGEHVLFQGTGWGHGVGMSQEGARGMAKKGMNYEAILKYYYRGTEIRTTK